MGVIAGALLCASGACGAHTGVSHGDVALAPPSGFHSLIDPTLSQWRGYTSPATTGWRVVGDTLMKSGSAVDLTSKRQYANFELDFDWKMAKGGNSGVFYRATQEYDEIYWSGPEYQLLDDANFPDGKDPLTSAGSDYGLYPVARGIVKPYDTWNSSRIIVDGEHVEHWLNGVKVVDYTLGSPDWKARLAKSKFAKYPHYGLATRGYIGIQGDHPGAIELRNVRIKELP